jgi:hypothetical protein
LRTSFAPIRLYLTDGANYDVTAHTSFGHVNSELPVTVSGTIGNDSLSGKIGNGGCELRLTDSNGGIEILKGARPR